MHGFFELSRYCYINEIMQSVTKKKNNKEEREKAQMKISKKSINLKNEIIKTKSEKAITLVALVVTIIVLLVLAGVAISLSIGNNGIISRGELSVEGNKLASYKEKLEMYKAEKIIENETFLAETLSAGKNTLEYNTKKEIGGTILNIIPELDERYIDKLEIIKGELFFYINRQKRSTSSKDSRNRI